MKQNNMGNWKQCLAARVLAVVLMLALVGTTIPATALAQKAGSGASVQNAVTTADIVVKDANGKVVDEIVFDGGVNNSKGVPAQMKALLQKHGVAKLTELPLSDYFTFQEEVEAIV